MKFDYVRDLLPVQAVPCHLGGGLVDYFKHCKREGKKKPCEFLAGDYECGYIYAQNDPRFKGGKITGTIKAVKR